MKKVVRYASALVLGSVLLLPLQSQARSVHHDHEVLCGHMTKLKSLSRAAWKQHEKDLRNRRIRGSRYSNEYIHLLRELAYSAEHIGREYHQRGHFDRSAVRGIGSIHRDVLDYCDFVPTGDRTAHLLGRVGEVIDCIEETQRVSKRSSVRRKHSIQRRYDHRYEHPRERSYRNDNRRGSSCAVTPRSRRAAGYRFVDNRSYHNSQGYYDPLTRSYRR